MAVFLFFSLPAEKKRETQNSSSSVSARAMDSPPSKRLIVPDLPPEEGKSCLRLCREHEVAPIMFFSPSSR
jgi:tryptophan synthase alpha subunit